MINRVNIYRVVNFNTGEEYIGNADQIGEKINVNPNLIRKHAMTKGVINDTYLASRLEKTTQKDVPDDFPERWDKAVAAAKQYLQKRGTNEQTRSTEGNCGT